MRPPYEWGCVHGRFQPFHSGHLEYALLAKKRCRRLLIGVTNPDLTWFMPEAANANRHTAESNPFTYFERALMLRDSCSTRAWRRESFSWRPSRSNSRSCAATTSPKARSTSYASTLGGRRRRCAA
jgi:cytidyltransferase-like protein